MNQLFALNKLFGIKFNIPSYQRGYRWEQQEVTELLDDLWDFQKTAVNGEFYCLQPIVVMETGDKAYDLIDGQQRLTTLYLALVYLEDFRRLLHYKADLFTITYETRPNCIKFLNGHEFKQGVNAENIDYFHICKAYRYIQTWFEDHEGAELKLTSILMDEDLPTNRNVKVIWYETSADENPIDAFIRLNVGKIPLTDAELIKALLLQSDKYTDKNRDLYGQKLFEIAAEWDQIEYALQDEKFWYFLNNNARENATHIELIFDLIADKQVTKLKFEGKDKIKHKTFLIINEYLENERGQLAGDPDADAKRMASVKKFWEEVIFYFGYFSDWYKDRKLFHFIGFLIAENGRSEIDHLIGQAATLSKPDFESDIRKRIKGVVNMKKPHKDKEGNEFFPEFEDLCYDSEDDGEYKQEIQRLLFLHNVLSTWNSDKELARFPFDLYKKTKQKKRWSLEHIHPQHIETVTDPLGQKAWLEDHIASLSNIDASSHVVVIERMMNLKARTNFTQDEFNAIVSEVNLIYSDMTDIPENAIHKIGNICLVDMETNSALNNSVFDVKREKIKRREAAGHYIPICTRNAFLKAYSDFPKNNYFWDDLDRKNYIKKMQISLKDFLEPRWQLKTK